MKKLTIGTLPVTNQICIGTVKNGLWQNDRVDVTDEALYAALEYLLKTSSKGVVFFGKGRLIAEPATGEIDMEIVK